MSEPKSPQSQNPAQNPGQHPPQRPPNDPPKDPYGGSKQPDPPPQKDPCDDPKPPDQKTPCPPPEKPCPPAHDCPDPPKRPCPPPDPCADEDEGDTTPAGDPTQQSSSPATQTGDSSAPPATPAAQLAALRKKQESGQKELQKLEPLKISLADLVQRIASLEKTVESQSSAASAYKEFYRVTEVARNEIDCFIPTVRCQLDLSDKQKKCICEAIEAVDVRVNKAKSDSAAASTELENQERKYKRAADDLAWETKWYEFLKTGLHQQITKQRDDLKALKQLADPSKDECEVWFYLYEMERLIKSSYGTEDACWKLDLSIGSFLDCWSLDCYEKAWNRAVVAFNDADAAEKLVKSVLEQAKKLAADLDKISKDAESKRREWILKEVKTKDCCGPMAKCP